MFAAAWRPRVRQEGLAERARIFSNWIVSWLIYLWGEEYPQGGIFCSVSRAGWLVCTGWDVDISIDSSLWNRPQNKEDARSC